MILVCENNGFAEFTPRSAHTNVERVERRGRALRLRARDGRRQRRARRARGVRRLPRRRRGREGPVPARVPDPPARRPLRGRPAALPRGARRRGVAGDRPDSPARRRRGLEDGGAGRGRGGGRVAVASPTVDEPRPLCRGAVPSSSTHSVYAVDGRPTSGDHDDARRGDARRRARLRARRGRRRGRAVGRRPPGLADEFGPERVRNTPISEAAIAGIAIGAAQSGLRPVVEIMFVDFVTLALDQLVNQAAKAHFMSGGQLTVPLVLRTQGGAGQRGGAQHSQSLEAWLDARARAEGGHAGHRRRRSRAARAPRSPTRTRSSSSRTRRSTSAREDVPAERPGADRPRPRSSARAATSRSSRSRGWSPRRSRPRTSSPPRASRSR